MPNNLETAVTDLAKLQQNMGRLSLRRQIERSLEPIHRYQLEMNRALKIYKEMTQALDVVRYNQRLRDLVEQTSTTSCIVESLSAAHESWLAIKNIQRDFSHIESSFARDVFDISLCLTATKRLIKDIDFEGIEGGFQIRMSVISGMAKSIADAAASYGTFAQSLRAVSDITRLPAFVFPGATREIYTTSFALHTLCSSHGPNEGEVKTEIQFVAEAERETSDCIDLLQQVDSRLVLPYIGARDALYGNNADRARHIMSSLRELWGHLLRRLAPDNLVTTWISGALNQKDLLHEGKPTRRARVLYVCRELNNDPLTDFLIHDTQALVKLIDLFNRVHELNAGLTDEQLRAIFLRSDSWLLYILQISSGDFHK